MTHIWGGVKWRLSVFRSYVEDNGELILNLDDGTNRKMNDWSEDTQTTLGKLKDLKQGDDIKVGTWEGYNQDIWFCDVEKI